MARRFTYGVNIAPLIDVVFILLAFILVYSRLDVTESIEVDLPKVEGQQLEAERPVILSINKEGEIFWGNNKIDMEELHTRTASIKKDQAVILQADREAQVEVLITVMSAMSKAGISSASIKVANQKH